MDILFLIMVGILIKMFDVMTNAERQRIFKEKEIFNSRKKKIRIGKETDKQIIPKFKDSRAESRPMVFTVKKKHRNDKYWHSLDNGDLKEWF